MNEQQAKQVIDLLFEIRNGIERSNELLEELVNPEPKPEKNEQVLTRKERREQRKQFATGGIVPGVEVNESHLVKGYVMITPEMVKQIDYNRIEGTIESIMPKFNEPNG